MFSKGENMSDALNYGDLFTTGIDHGEASEVKSQMGIVSQVPLLSDALDALSMVLVSCGDTNGFIADQITEAISSLNAFCQLVLINPAGFIVQLNSSDEFLSSQIEYINKFLNRHQQ